MFVLEIGNEREEFSKRYTSKSSFSRVVLGRIRSFMGFETKMGPRIIFFREVRLKVL